MTERPTSEGTTIVGSERVHEGRVALVTGGSQGIGRGIALTLARRGASVVVHGLTEDYVDETVALIRDAGGTATGTYGPIDQEQTSTDAVAQAIETYGRLDHLVTAAGIQGLVSFTVKSRMQRTRCRSERASSSTPA